MWMSLWALLILVMTTDEVNGQVSISSLRSTAESSNLEVRYASRRRPRQTAASARIGREVWGPRVHVD